MGVVVGATVLTIIGVLFEVNRKYYRNEGIWYDSPKKLISLSPPTTGGLLQPFRSTGVSADFGTLQNGFALCHGPIR